MDKEDDENEETSNESERKKDKDTVDKDVERTKNKEIQQIVVWNKEKKTRRRCDK